MENDYAAVDPTAAMLVQFVPLMIFQVLYAVVVFMMARKQAKNSALWTIGTLIPVVGMFVFTVFFITTLLSMLDRLNALEGKERA